MQALAELGVVGLLLLAAALLTGFAAGLTALARQEPARRATLAAALAALGGFTVACAFDWIWQLPAVAVVGIVALGMTTGVARGGRANGAGGLAWRLRRYWPAVLAAVALAAIVAEAVPLLSQLQLDSSRSHAAAGDLPRAVEAATRARSLMPWNATPYLQVALVAEQGGNLSAARAWIREARRRDRSDWRLWLTSARIEAESGQVAAARRSLRLARTLNPRLPFAR
jgi:tetratricopeptide (TPR) repeat protein